MFKLFFLFFLFFIFQGCLRVSPAVVDGPIGKFLEVRQEKSYINSLSETKRVEYFSTYPYNIKYIQNPTEDFLLKVKQLRIKKKIEYEKRKKNQAPIKTEYERRREHQARISRIIAERAYKRYENEKREKQLIQEIKIKKDFNPNAY